MSLIFKADADSAVRFSEIRRYQVYRLERKPRRPLLQRLRRTIRARLYR
jgi:hypothetical protein